MPGGRGVESEEEDAVFLSPEWDPCGADQGVSPQLRRSARKRKSTAGGGEESMSKGSSSKKKKQSPSKMPKVPRSPVAGQNTGQGTQGQSGKTTSQEGTQSFEALLLAMEGRLAAKLEKASEASKEAAHQAKLNSESLELLESRVDANEECLMDALRKSEERIMARVQVQVQEAMQERVKEMVNAQLDAAGFDRDLTAADLTVRWSALVTTDQDNMALSYAGAVSRRTETTAISRRAAAGAPEQTRSDKREDKFWLARRSLRLWPIKGGNKDSLEEYMRDKDRLDNEFISEELGEVVLVKPRESRNKNKDEYIAIFESK